MNAFKPILEALAEWDGQHFGGDVAVDLQESLRAALKKESGHDNQLGDMLFVASFSRFAERAAFDLGLMEACPAPADGEVVVHGDRIKRLLRLIDAWDAPERARLLGELLAVIHRDGGQYLDEHGCEKATQDAIEAVHRLRVEVDESLHAWDSADKRVGELEAERDQALNEAMAARKAKEMTQEALDDATRTLAESARQVAAERTRAEKAEAEVADYRVQLRPHSEPAAPGLPPCPFCGDTVLFMTSSPRFPGCPAEWDGSTSYSICCRSCASHGGWAKSIEGARDNWAMCGPGGDRPTPYHIIRERREQELRDRAEKAEKSLRAAERRLTSPVGFDALHDHAAWCYRVEYHEDARCCCGVADDEEEK